MSPKLAVIKIALHIVTFIDFLEDLPQKTVKYIIKMSILSSIVIFFLVLLGLEVQKQSISNLIVYLFIPESRISTQHQLVVEYPMKIAEIEFPEITATSVLVADISNKTTLYERNADVVMAPASTTKLLTAMVALDLYSPNEIVSIPVQCTEIDTQRVGFYPDELITVKDLIYSMLVTSGGDSACALAYGKIPYGQFIGLMNKKALEIGATSSNFSNPIGLDDVVAAQHYSTANDLYIIALNAISDPYIADVVRLPVYELESGLFARAVANTNVLLWEVAGSVGIKTGKTPEAGEVLIYEYKKDATDLMIIVMGSENRFEDTKKVLDWSLSSFDFGP